MMRNKLVLIRYRRRWFRPGFNVVEIGGDGTVTWFRADPHGALVAQTFSHRPILGRFDATASMLLQPTELDRRKALAWIDAHPDAFRRL